VAGVVDPDCRVVERKTEPTLEQATWATPFWRVGWNFRPALRTKSQCASHYLGVACGAPLSYCAKFYQRLRPHCSNSMAYICALFYDSAVQTHPSLTARNAAPDALHRIALESFLIA